MQESTGRVGESRMETGNLQSSLVEVMKDLMDKKPNAVELQVSAVAWAELHLYDIT